MRLSYLAAVAALALTADHALAQKKPAAPAATGVVKSVDATANTITLGGKKKKGGEADPDQVLAVAKDAKVVVSGEAKTLADVKAGAVVTVTLTADHKTALSVAVGGKKKGGPAVESGTVKSVDGTANTITLEGSKGKDGNVGEARTLAIAKDAKVSIDGKDGKLADVKAGAVVALALAADGKSATAVTVGRKKKKPE